MGGEGTASLTAKLGRATYVTDTGNLPPGSGAMSLVFLTKGIVTIPGCGQDLSWRSIDFMQV